MSVEYPFQNRGYIRRRHSGCGLGKENKKRKKKDSGKLAIRPDHPRRRIEVKVCMPGGLR